MLKQNNAFFTVKSKLLSLSQDAIKWLLLLA